jgi:type II secretory pathway component PulJ
VTLTETEQKLLDGAAIEVMQAEAEMRAHTERTDDLRTTMAAAGGRLRGLVEALLAARGEDLSEYTATWSSEQERFVVAKKQGEFVEV